MISSKVDWLLVCIYFQDTATATQAMKALSDFSRITLETSLPSESEELRLCTAQVLGSTHVTDLMVDRQGTLGTYKIFLHRPYHLTLTGFP